MKKPKNHAALPEITEDMDDERKEETQESIDKIKLQNENIDKENNKSARIKNKICIQKGDNKSYNEEDEMALIKLMNHRDMNAAAQDNILSARTGNSKDN